MVSKNDITVNDPVAEFSPSLWEQITTKVEFALKTDPKAPRIAAFDADGTLWDADAGETFFDWQIHNSGLKGLPADPWAHYEETKKQNPIPAYVWLAQISAGQELAQVREWARQCFAQKPTWPVFASQKKLINWLRERDFEIYIVTASIKWAVEPVASLVGVDFDHVLGITTKLENGRVGMETVHPVTWRQGKADGLLAATGGVRPLIASGNTYGDIALLETATAVQLAVSTQAKACGLFEEEHRLRVEAQRRGWTQHAFRVPHG